VRGWLAAVALLLATASSFAHLRFPAVRAERWLELRLGEDPIRIGYRLGFGAALAKEQRKAADRDGDGEVSAAEGNAALDAKTLELLGGLRVCTGDSLEQLDCQQLRQPDVELVEAEGWIPGPTGHLHFAWTLRLRTGARKLGAIRIEDGWETPGVEITEVSIQSPPERPLTRAGEGDSPDGTRLEFTWIEARRGSGPRVVAASWPKESDRVWPLLVIAGALIVAGTSSWYRAHKRARSAAGSG
jgi:hypothetical protein